MLLIVLEEIRPDNGLEKAKLVNNTMGMNHLKITILICVTSKYVK